VFPEILPFWLDCGKVVVCILSCHVIENRGFRRVVYIQSILQSVEWH
jgi:hypothetical protein